jgi:hypothetical protein
MLVAVNRSSSINALHVPTEGNVLQGCSKLTRLSGDEIEFEGFNLVLPPFGFAIYAVN